MPWSGKTYTSTPGYVADPETVNRNTGRQIDWETVDAAYIPEGGTRKVIPGGTPMTEQEDGTIVPGADGEAEMLLWSTATEGQRTDAISGYGCLIGGVIYRELLPVDIADYEAALAAAGCLFQYETYADDRITAE